MDNWNFPAPATRMRTVQVMARNPARVQGGVTIIETLGAVAITAMLVLGLTSMVDSSMDDLKGQQAAFHQSQVARAAERYIRSNYDSLIDDTAGGDVKAVTMTDLKNGRFLSNGFSDTNNYNQTPCMLVRQTNPGQLDALVATYGGEKIPERHIRMVGLQSGPGGGYISEAEPAVARGASWNLNTVNYRNVACNGATVLNGSKENDGGHLVSALFHDGSGEATADFLYRDPVPGKPELNRMNTPIRMGGVAQVNVNDNCRVDGDVVPGVAVDLATNQILYCSTAGQWTRAGSSHWKDPVAAYASLPLAAAGSEVGDVRLVTGINRAFAFDGSTWKPLAVDQNGNLTVPGNIIAEGTIHADGHISTDKDVNIKENLRVDGKVYNTLRVDVDVEVGRNVIADGVSAETWMYASAVHLGSVMAPGGVCNYPNGSGEIAYPVGTAVTDADGLLMSCYQVPGTETYYFDYPRNFGHR